MGSSSKSDKASENLKNEIYAYLDGHSLLDLLRLINEVGKLHQEMYDEIDEDGIESKGAKQ